MWRTNRPWSLVLIAVVVALFAGGSAMAAEVSSGEVYRLGADQVVNDDLVIMAREIYIDGTVKGDLVAIGQLVELNGTVEGDAMIAAAELRLSGSVEDDARLAGAGVSISGQIGDDLFAAAGGGESGAYPLMIEGRNIPQGLDIASSSTIGGSAYVGAGSANLAGMIAQDLRAGAGLLSLGATVKGDADLDVATFSMTSGGHVDGRLTYTAAKEAAVPTGAAGEVRFVPPPPPQPQNLQSNRSAGGQLMRIAMMILGFTMAGALLLRFAPASLRRPAEAIAARPTQAGLYGLAAIALLFIIPIASLLLIIAVIALWGWLPGLMCFLFLTAALVLAWTLSPLITGLWLGRALMHATGRQTSDLIALLTGATLIVLLSFVPLVGWLISLASLLLAVGGLLLTRRGSFDAPAPMAAPAATVS